MLPQPVFDMPVRTAAMLRRDLAAAEISDQDGAGRVFDFHALRGQYITALVKSGASVKIAQELARHSDPKLTMNVYTHLTIPDKQKALEAMPAVTKGTKKKKRGESAG